MQTLIDKESILEQLVGFYYKHDKFQDAYLNIPEAKALYKALFERNLLCLSVNPEGKLLGYGEAFRISYETFGKIICGWNVYRHLEETDLETGPIAYVANVTIAPEHRGSGVLKDLTSQFFQKMLGATHYCGRAFRKRHQPVKVFDFHESYLKWIKEK